MRRRDSLKTMENETVFPGRVPQSRTANPRPILS
jgi:hypothetical protein